MFTNSFLFQKHWVQILETFLSNFQPEDVSEKREMWFTMSRRVASEVNTSTFALVDSQENQLVDETLSSNHTYSS